MADSDEPTVMAGSTELTQMSDEQKKLLLRAALEQIEFRGHGGLQLVSPIRTSRSGRDRSERDLLLGQQGIES